MRTRYAIAEDKTSLLRMRNTLWPDSAKKHSDTLAKYFEGMPTFIDQIVVCENDRGDLIGFSELRIRNYAGGSENMAVPFLEGWYVDASHRGTGIGALLISGAEEWARSLGYPELASDTEIDNNESIRAHLALGFQETERSVCFLKKL